MKGKIDPRRLKISELDQKIIDLFLAGNGRKQIAAKTGRSLNTISYSIWKGRQKGIVPSIYGPEGRNRPKTISARLQSLRNRLEETDKSVGSMAEVLSHLTLNEINWLAFSIPAGSSLAEMLAGMIQERYQEDLGKMKVKLLQKQTPPASQAAR